MKKTILYVTLAILIIILGFLSYYAYDKHTSKDLYYKTPEKAILELFKDIGNDDFIRHFSVAHMAENFDYEEYYNKYLPNSMNPIIPSSSENMLMINTYSMQEKAYDQWMTIKYYWLADYIETGVYSENSFYDEDKFYDLEEQLSKSLKDVKVKEIYELNREKSYQGNFNDFISGYGYDQVLEYLVVVDYDDTDYCIAVLLVEFEDKYSVYSLESYYLRDKLDLFIVTPMNQDIEKYLNDQEKIYEK